MTSRNVIEDQAALWLIRRDEPEWTAEAQAELDAWLNESIAHKAAFWRLEHGWRAADRVASLAAVPVRRRLAPSWHSAVGSRMRYIAPFAVAAALVVTLFLSLPFTMREGAVEQSYRTAIGQVRTIAVADGSRIEMNTATRLRTQIAANARDAWLEKGEAFFEIRHDTSRPFRVHAGSKTITVLGTRFSVRRDGDRVTVAVVSGRVRIDDDDSAARLALKRSSTARAGDVAVSAGSSILVSGDASSRISTLTAWRDGMAVFDQTTLPDAIAELNRYTATPIVIDDPSLAQFRVGGAFRLDNRDGFLRLLQSAYGLRVERDKDRVRVSR